MGTRQWPGVLISCGCLSRATYLLGCSPRHLVLFVLGVRPFARYIQWFFHFRAKAPISSTALQATFARMLVGAISDIAPNQEPFLRKSFLPWEHSISVNMCERFYDSLLLV